MQKKEEKNKSSSPKVDDSETAKVSTIMIIVVTAMVAALLLGSILSMTNTNVSSLQGALNISSCDAYVDNVKDTTAKLKWDCSRGKIKAYSVYLATEEGNIGFPLPFVTKINSKSKGSENIKKLSPGTDYIVKAVTSDNKIITTDLFHTEGTAKIKIKGKSITSNTMTIAWDSTSLKSAAKKVTLTPTKKEGEPEVVGSRIAFTKTGVVTFRNLNPETEYMACVELRNNKDVNCETFTTKDQYNVISKSALNAITVSWGSTTSAKLKSIEIYAADENYNIIDTIKTKTYDKPKKAGTITAKNLNQSVFYLVKATFDNGHVVTQKKKVFSSYKYYVASTDKDIVISWADTKTKVSNITVTMLDENDMEEKLIINQPYEEGKKSGYLRVPNLEQDRYYLIKVKYEDNKEVVKTVKTLYAYNILVLPGSTTATVSWANTTAGVSSVILEKIDESDENRTNSVVIDSKNYSNPIKIGLAVFKNLEPKTAYSVTVKYENNKQEVSEFRTLPKVNLEDDSSAAKILNMLKLFIIK